MTTRALRGARAAAQVAPLSPSNRTLDRADRATLARPAPRALLVLALLSFATCAWALAVDVASCDVASVVFDTMSLACASCPGTLVVDSTTTDAYGSATRCRCPAGFAAVDAGCGNSVLDGCVIDTCTNCVSLGRAPDRTRTRCVPCPGDGPLNTATGECECAAGSVLVDPSPFDTSANKTCVPCGPNSLVSADGYSCQTCPDPNMILTPGTGAAFSCACGAGYTLVNSAGFGSAYCVLTARLGELNARQVGLAVASALTYRSVERRTGASGQSFSLPGAGSSSLAYFYPRAATSCLFFSTTADVEACHALANLCTLQLFDPTTAPCILFLAMVSSREATEGQLRTLPWLYYAATDDATGSTELSKRFSFDASTQANTQDTLLFYLAAYALNGTFLGFELLQWQLQYCAPTPRGTGDSPAWLNFGTALEDAYTCDLRTLLDQQLAQPAGAEVTFYDLYFIDTSGPNDGAASPRDPLLPVRLFPVPVRITNLVSANGGRPNQNSKLVDEENDVFVRRFFLVDAVSGMTGAREAGNVQVVRYAQRVLLTIPTREGAKDLLLPPVLTITYAERLASDFLSDTSFARVNVEFVVAYRSDNSSFWTAALTLFAIAQTIAFGLAILRYYNWLRRATRTMAESACGLHSIVRALVYLCHTFSQASFFVMMLLCFYFFCFFKLQDRVFVLLFDNGSQFDNNDYEVFFAMLWTTAVTHFIRILEILYVQCHTDMFFIDWEKPRGPTVRLGADFEMGMRAREGEVALPSANKYPPVSIWRTLFMANEWSELQTVRRVNLVFTYALLAVLLDAAKLQYVATPQPTANDLTPGPVDPILRFANSAFWLAILYLSQLIYKVLLHERYVEQSITTRFIDLCTVSKISVFIMDDPYHGYYLHCDAPYEFADGDMRQLIQQLHDEAGNVRAGRGLIGSPDSDCQTFELFVPEVWRRKYNEHFNRLHEYEERSPNLTLQQSRAAAGGARTGAAGEVPTTRLKPTLRDSRNRELMAIRHETALAITRFLKGFVVSDQMSSGIRRVFRERTYVQKFFAIPPDIDAENMASGVPMGGHNRDQGTAVLFLDHEMTFESTMFRGVEWDLLLFSFLIFSIALYHSNSPILAAFFTILIDRLLCVIRTQWGQSNIAAKTLVDDRFLD